MYSTYTKDLELEIAYKLNGNDIFNISKVSAGWSQLVNNEFWMTKFIRDFGASLPNGANYELEYIIMQDLDRYAELGRYLIDKHYIKLLNIIAIHSLDHLLSYAVKMGKLEIVQLLIAKGANIESRANTALIIAASNGYLEIFKLLIAEGANIHAQEDEALVLAALNGKVEIVKVLIANGADIDAQGGEALYYSVLKGHLKIVELLLANGANIHAQNDLALKTAAREGWLDIIELLNDYM